MDFGGRGGGCMAGVIQQPPMHQLRMSPFNLFCGWTSSLPVEIFFFTSFLPRNSLPPPSYLPPTKPTPPPTSTLLPTTYQPHPRSLHRQSSRDLERLWSGSWSYGCGAGAGAVVMERELERLELELDRLELERDPRAHEKVRCLRFCFVFFVCFVWRRLEKFSSSSFFAAL
jgi:hypothetical protein